MATKTVGNLIPSNTDVPLDARARVATLADVSTIGNPYIGLLVYVAETNKVYVVTGLKSKTVAGIQIPNALVDTYEEISGKDGADGAPGKDGEDGAPGKDGEPGAPGKDGEDGVTPSISIGTVSVVDSPEEANVSVADGSTDKDVILDFAIPRGPAGETDSAALADINTKLDAIDATLAEVTNILEELVNSEGGDVVVQTSEDDILKALLVFSK